MERDDKLGAAAKIRIIFRGKDRWRIALILLMSLVSAFLETSAVALMYPFMNCVMGTVGEAGGVLTFIRAALGNPGDRAFMFDIALIIACIYLLKSLHSMLFLWVKNRSIMLMRTDLTSRVLSSLLEKPWSYHLSRTSAESVRMVNAVDSMFMLVDAVISLTATGISALAILVVLCRTSIKLTVIVALLISVTLFISRLFIAGAVVRTGSAKWRSIAETNNVLLQIFNGVKSIYITRRRQHFINSYADAYRNCVKADAKASTIGGVPRYFTEAVCMSGIFIYLAVLVARGDDIVALMPAFATFALAAMRLMPMANIINDQANSIRYHRVDTDNVCRTVLENEGSAGFSSPIRPERSVSASRPLREGVRAEHISFGYPGSEPLYKDATVIIPAGKSVAFIGKTGAGKTTMADIILGLHRPQSGKVTADGIDISEDPDAWADAIGYIPQSIFISNGSVRENVAYGFRTDTVDDARVWECLADAQLADFVKRLPDGLDTAVGENGIRLSGGQRQRLGVARALYTDPAFIVLDEATSSLDTETEQALVDAINSLSGKKTMLTIAHRLSTIEGCDIVYRIENGAIETVRAPEELMPLLKDVR